MKPLWHLNVLLLLIGAVSLTISGCKSEPHLTDTPPPLPKRQVKVAEAQLVPVHNQIELLGTVESVNSAEIAAKLSGTITDVPVKMGSMVSAGDLLVVISAGEIDAKVEKARAQLAQARRNLTREQKLLAKNAATQETVKSLRESLQIAEAAFAEAQTMQSYTRIKAPFKGSITRKMVDIGDLATPGKPLLTLEDENHLQVVTDIPEAFLLQVKKGDVLSVSVPAAGLTIPGTVAEVAPTASPLSHTAPIKLAIDATPRLRPGQFARVTLAAKVAKTLTVPQQAIFPFGQMERIFVVKNGIAHLRLVRTGAEYGNDIEILSGLTAGERVVVGGQHIVMDGQPVTVL